MGDGVGIGVGVNVIVGVGVGVNTGTGPVKLKLSKYVVTEGVSAYTMTTAWTRAEWAVAGALAIMVNS